MKRLSAHVWLPDERGGAPSPGRLGEVELPVLAVGERRLQLPGLVVTDDRPGVLFEELDLRFDPSGGGGPFLDEAARREARAFGVVNVAHHLHRGLERIAALLGRPLPPLRVRVGSHVGRARPWAGGHYRLPATSYSELPEPEPPAPEGEIHLGAGRRFLVSPLGPYFDSPAHNVAIAVHELGHHVCRHTADFRLNRSRPVTAQANRKIPLDEGTSDYLAAVLLGSPDIYGWHRSDVSSTHPARRRLDAGWTMAMFRGGSDQDPHADGTVWANALWTARGAVATSGGAAEEFDALVVRGLDRIGRTDAERPRDEAFRRRRHFGRALAAILEEDAERGDTFGDVVRDAFASHGIVVGLSNRDLRDRARRHGLGPAAAHTEAAA